MLLVRGREDDAGRRRDGDAGKVLRARRIERRDGRARARVRMGVAVAVSRGKVPEIEDLWGEQQ